MDRYALTKCFAHYDREDIISALSETNTLFCKLAKDVAKIKNYHYPEYAVNYAKYLFGEYFCG